MSAPRGNKNAIGNKGGRPAKLPKDLLKITKEYLKQCEDELEEVVRQTREEDGTITKKTVAKVNLPSIAGLARWLDVSRETIYAWQEEDLEFSDICSKILAEQERRLIDNGLSGGYNSNITKLLLHKHGYSDKSELTGKDDGPLKLTLVNYADNKGTISTEGIPDTNN
jgi:hypothetical protein